MPRLSSDTPVKTVFDAFLRLFQQVQPLLLILLASASTLPAQDRETGTVEGRVFNEITQRYVERAEITVDGTNIRAFTNFFGEYTLRNVPAGRQRIIAAYTGMQTRDANITVQADQTVVNDFRFSRKIGTDEDAVFEMEEFVVDASNFQSMEELAVNQERHSVNLVNVVSTEAYGIVSQGNVGEFVKYIPGVTIGYGGSNTAGGTYSSGADANTISIRGYSARETAITIDGMPIANAAPGTLDPAVGLDMMSINNASRVEVIKVPSPDQPNAGIGGTVNLISMSAFEYPKPTLKFRVYLSMNSEQLDIFSKTPGPMNEPTYKALPSFNLTYAYPFNDKIGLSLTLSSDNQANANYTLKSRVQRNPEAGRPTRRSETSTFTMGQNTSPDVDPPEPPFSYWLEKDAHFEQWQQTYGEDWTQWTEEEFVEMYSTYGPSQGLLNLRLPQIKRLPRYDSSGNLIGAWAAEDLEALEEDRPLYYDAEGNLVGRVYQDWNHPYIARVQVTDSPRIANRNSGALKLDWRPFSGFLVSANYQVSTFKDQDANRRVHMISGFPFEYGPDYSLSNDGGVRLDTDAFGREGITHSAYLKASYIKGPWDISGNISYSTSKSDLLSQENGHFSVVEINMGGVDYTEFLDIDRDGVPATINYYRDITDNDGNVTGRELIDIGDLSNYQIANFDPEDPTAGELRVRAGGIHATSEVVSAKFDIRRQLDFIPVDFMNLAVKVGGDWEERKNAKQGRGSNYEYVYLGQEGDVLNLADFRDENYVGVDPGFGLEPLEWPDPFALYQYHLDNPGAFSDTDDTVPPGQGSESVAAHNYLEEVNSSKSITETNWAYYAQLEGDFFNNRLSVIGGFRMGFSEREGYDRGQNFNWNNLHYDRDENGDGIRDVFRDHEGVDIDPIYAEFGTDTLPAFELTGPFILLRELRQSNPRVTTFEELPPDRQEYILGWYRYYEEAGAVYPDGAPFIASEYTRVATGSLQAYQYQYLKDFPIKQKAAGKPQPIISAAYDITDQLVARVSWSTTYSNPPYESSEGAAGTLRRVEFVENPGGGGTMSVTNPELEISKTIGWDVGLSYYTETGGKYSLTLYHRKEEGRAVGVSYDKINSFEAWDSIMRSLGYGPGSYFYGSADPNVDPADDTTWWTVTTSVNSSGTFIDYGYELEARQDLRVLGSWGRHIYVYGSFFQQFQEPGTIPEGEEGVFEVPLGNETRLNASGGININWKRLEFRINATWRNERTEDASDAIVRTAIFWPDATVGNPGWYTPTADDDLNDPYYHTMRLVRPESLRIDLSAKFRLTEHLTLDFSARNITKDNPEPIYVRDDGGELPYLGHLHDGTEKSIYGINFTIGISGVY